MISIGYAGHPGSFCRDYQFACSSGANAGPQPAQRCPHCDAGEAGRCLQTGSLWAERSEKADPDQFDLALEDIETAIAIVHAEEDTADRKAQRPAKKRTANRGALPGRLPRIEVVVEPDSLTCACGGGLHGIGEDSSERLDVIPARFRVIVTRRPKYACRACTDGLAQAPAVPRLIQGGLPTEATIAHVIVSKYVDHLRLYRQAQIYARQGVDLDRSTLADWVGRAAFELRPVFDALMRGLKQSIKLFMDETRAPALDPGARKTKTGYSWALARDDRPLGWNGTGRGGQHAERILQGFSGILQVDGYAGYNRLLTPNRSIQLAYCWAHARRKLVEVTRMGPAHIAQEGLGLIRALYTIEAEITGTGPETRLQARQNRSVPVMAELSQWIAHNRARLSAKSNLGEAMTYLAKYWDGLQIFLTDGGVEINNNPVERAIRPIALSRKNALFAGHEDGAENWAMIASLIETCKLNKVDPFAWLSDTLTAIVQGHKQSDIDRLIPWAFRPDV